MPLMGGAVAGDIGEADWKRRRRRGDDGREVAGRMSSSAGGGSVTADVLSCRCTTRRCLVPFGAKIKTFI